MLEYQEREWEIEQAVERNKHGANIPIPAWYSQKKGVPDNLRWFWQAFWELDTCRHYVDTLPKHIPWTAAQQYAAFHDINFDYLWHLLVEIDNAYIDWKVKQRIKEHEEMKKKASRSKAPARGRRNG